MAATCAAVKVLALHEDSGWDTNSSVGAELAKASDLDLVALSSSVWGLGEGSRSVAALALETASDLHPLKQVIALGMTLEWKSE